jgi:predicted phosphodiesterase
VRFLILSDLHANWEALEAVLADAEGQYERIVCCGDLVGYGPDPERVTGWVRANVPVVVRGNHDRACSGLEDLEWFNPVARKAAEWTQEVLSAENLAYLRALPKGPLDLEGLSLVHGSPVDEDQYVVTTRDAAQLWNYLPEQRTFFGHTHLQGGFEFIKNRARGIPQAGKKRRELELGADSWYLINPGSTGQPRDGDPKAAWVLYDSDVRLVTYCRTRYDLEATQSKILAAGLPEVLALRLAGGN